ncbi:tolB protein precursor, periplasmic protein involved in the tonb-independent uptake of group A colicins [hydrothermal vent metagenome]|uniref:TolB protein, periplasmic protein involved in the tonb-independent uptake of group A colicins n=1 Tax=hydrothermal vent metagenome TaxID=652676 RepID=A0A3B0Y0K1_9ZZZZ
MRLLTILNNSIPVFKRLNRKLLSAFLFSFLSFLSSNVLAVDPRLNWKTIESENFYIHYGEGYERLAQKAANAAEKAHHKLQPAFNWSPKDKTHLVISDEMDAANGYATPLFFNRSVLFMAPPDGANTLEDFDDWLETLITHEYTHILHLDKSTGAQDVLRNIFGRNIFAFPNALQPGWLTEGLATYYETDQVQSIGRGQSSVYKMMMRTEIESGIKPVEQVNLPIKSWPVRTVSYLYGVHFYQFVEEKYGSEAIQQLVENYSNNIIPFMINTNSDQVLGKDLNGLWDEFSLWLNEKYIDDFVAVEGKKITQTGYSTGASAIAPDGQLYYVSNGAFEHAALMLQSESGSQQLSEIQSTGAQIDVHQQAGVLLTQLEYCDEYNINSDIYILSPGEDEAHAITVCGRYRSAAWSPDGEKIIAVQTDKAKSKLVILNAQGEVLAVPWKGNDTDIVSQLKWSPDGKKILAAVFRTLSGWNIEEFDLETNKWIAITNDRYIDMYPSYSDKGESILFSSERSGRYQIYRYLKNSQRLQQITRVKSGAFVPLQLNQHSPLYYVGYNSNGRDVYRLDNHQDKVASVETVDLNNTYQNRLELAVEVATSQPEDYSAISTMRPRWWFPSASVSKDRSEYGISTAGGDALGVDNYVLNVAYDTTNNWLVGDIRYAYANRFAIGYQRSTEILTDINGDFAVARNVDDLFMSGAFNYPGIESSMNYLLGLLVSETKDGIRAAGIPEQRDISDNLLGGAFLYNNTKNYIRSISKSDGRSVRLLAETTEALKSDYSGEVYTLDWREYIGLGSQNVLALRFVQGWGTDQPKPFRLGGEDNEFDAFSFINPVSEPLFGRRSYALRGYAEGLPQLRGRHLQLATLEWRFPGSLIERGWMSPPLGIIQWSGSVFAESGAAYTDSKPEEYYSSVGFELQGDINLFYGITSRMVLGFANGLDKNIGENRVYFNLGASF